MDTQPQKEQPSNEVPGNESVPAGELGITVRRQGQHPDAEERAALQALFLKAFSRTANVSAACLQAGIHRSTIYRWQEVDLDFSARYQEASDQANDLLRLELHRRAVTGIDRYIVSMGKLVYEETPVLGPDGQQRFDAKGKPLMKPTKPLTIKEYSDSLFTLLLKARMPEFREKQQLTVDATAQVNVTQSVGQLSLDVRNMTQDELNTLRRLAQDMKEREERRHGGSKDEE